MKLWAGIYGGIHSFCQYVALMVIRGIFLWITRGVYFNIGWVLERRQEPLVEVLLLWYESSLCFLMVSFQYVKVDCNHHRRDVSFSFSRFLFVPWTIAKNSYFKKQKSSCECLLWNGILDGMFLPVHKMEDSSKAIDLYLHITFVWMSVMAWINR